MERQNPARLSEIVGSVECVDPAGAAAAVDAAHVGFRDWSRRPAEERASLLAEAADDVLGTADELGPLLARELGKVVGDCRGEMGFAAACLRYCLDAHPRVAADSLVDDAAGRLLVTKVPYGVVTAIVPWNAPLILSILKVAPALVTGNSIVVKPSPIAPLAVTQALSAIAACLPDGVLNVVHGGAEVGEVLVSHPDVRKVAFTGGGTTAVHVARAAATTITPLVLELGGNDAALFLEDAEFSDRVMERAVFGTFLTSGQVCMAAKRLYVPRTRHDEFVEAYLRAAERVLTVGDPLDPEVTMGPMASAPQRRFVEDLLLDANDRGAIVHTLGTVTPDCDLGAGWFLRPTLVTGLDDDAPLVAQEQFGPAVPLLAYDSLDEALDRVNDSELGLASSVWSADEDRAFDVARRIEAGMTFVNCHNRAGMSLRAPFGGVKQSGFGREFGDAGVAEYLQSHTIHAPASARGDGTGSAANAYPT